MFIGHFAVAFAVKKASPRTSLGTLFIAAQLADLLWPILLLVGVEHARITPGDTAVTPLDLYDYPFSHSLLLSLVWAVLPGLAYWRFRRDRMGGLVIGATVFSHWILDLLTHRPDLPLYPGSSYFLGLGLWNTWAGTLIVEVLLFVTGVSLYFISTKARDRIGTYGTWGLILTLVIMYAAALFGPPPPDIHMVAIAGNGIWLFVLWAFWTDRHRSARAT
jgi:membrane-bound metal-dependent hydrolase YbcI (DUF457 family)